MKHRSMAVRLLYVSVSLYLFLIVSGCQGKSSSSDVVVNNGIQINNGAAFTTSKTVNLSIAPATDVVYMQVSEDVNFVNVQWEPVLTEKQWTFSGDFSTGGTATIYAKFQQSNGGTSSPMSASIYIDTDPRVALVSPLNDDTITTILPNVIWKYAPPIQGARYRIQIANDLVFASVVQDVTTQSDMSHYAFTVPLDTPQTYFWRVALIEESGTQWNWSSPWSFKIDSTPAVVSAGSPTAGAVDVPLTTGITAVFNEPIDAATIQTPATRFVVYSNSTGTVGGTVTYDAPTKTALFIPNRNFAYNTTYKVTIKAGAKDIYGNESQNDVSWSFTTHAPLSGEQDLTFGRAGDIDRMMRGSVTDYGLYACAVQGDGKLLVAGSDDQSSYTQSYLARFTSDGSLDPAFNATGIAGGPHSSAILQGGIRIRSNGNIVAAWPDYSYNSAGVTQFTTNGMFVSSFTTTAVGKVRSLALQTDDSIVMMGLGAIFSVARFTSDGSPDSSFAGSGFVNPSNGDWANLTSLVIQEDGKILVGGSANYWMNVFDPSANEVKHWLIPRFVLFRYNANGTLDASFNTTGIVSTSTGSSSEITALAVQPDGKIVAAGYSSTNYWGGPTGNDPSITIARYNSDGSLDNTFNSTGIVRTLINGTATPVSVVVQSDGKILIGGNSGSRLVIVRYKNDGTLDTTFADAGVSLVSNGVAHARSMCVQPDGKIVLSGSGGVGSLVMRFWP